MKTKKTLFLKKVTISNLSEKHMNDLRGGCSTPPPTLNCTSGVVGTVNFCAACAENACPAVE